MHSERPSSISFASENQSKRAHNLRRANCSRRPWTLARACGFGTALLALGSFVIPVQYITEQPGPTFNTIGEYDGKQLITIEGEKSYPVEGQLDMTTVSVAGGPNTDVNSLYVLANFFDKASNVVPSALMYAPTTSSDEVSAQNAADMTDSQQNAEAAALTYLKKDFTEKLVVAGLADDSASADKIQENDVVTAINGEKLEHYDQLNKLVDESDGKEITVTVKRDGEEHNVAVTPRYNEDSQKYLLGLYIKKDYTFPFTVNYGLEEVGGPSAGMMFALGIIDELNEVNMTGGKHFAGTGTIDSAGNVGAIGGAPQKLTGAQDAGAEIFLLPADNCADVAGRIPEGLTVIPVKTLDEAAQTVQQIGEGSKDPSDFASCPAP